LGVATGWMVGCGSGSGTGSVGGGGVGAGGGDGGRVGAAVGVALGGTGVLVLVGEDVAVGVSDGRAWTTGVLVPDTGATAGGPDVFGCSGVRTGTSRPPGGAGLGGTGVGDGGTGVDVAVGAGFVGVGGTGVGDGGTGVLV
jgi:hypothetical protein